ncbi:tyrosine-type recombinase/integrase [Mangrovimonas sp. YM274]|uniref:tyrosine-type recombinase/integrase n=1 Tax=Mangrovimonas sp. YM274 TaxID=3070660 RepID=UPI0027DBCBAA|nr:tyrosine-type recombinase/integrase [Mangrovimonas sp. YM274]WMI68171.1 tyrosine-type recombinase/integrase [Mangrovimonas sp. YM274]
MFKISDILRGEYESEYANAYDLSNQKQFSKPKIYTANGDLSKRWYVYFSFRDPKNNKLTRQSPIYASANRYKTKEERMAILTVYSQTLHKLLKRGYDPYADNVDLFKKEQNKKAKQNTASKEGEVSEQPLKLDLGHPGIKEEDKGKTLAEAFEFDMSIKQRSLRESSMRSYKSHIKVFREWLEKSHKEITHIQQVDRPVVMEFLNHIMDSSSPRNRNNYRASLSSMFQTLEDNDIVSSNFIKKIVVLKSSPKRNKTYTKGEQQEIFEYLEKNDPMLLLFIKFVSYNFIRPIEVCRLKVGDIDVEHKTVTFRAKNSPLKTKLIPEILLEELPDMSKMEKGDFLFTPEGLGGKWELSDDNKRNYFSKRFKKVVKDEFGLDEDYGLYSFRHTFITKLYREMIKDSSPHAVKSKLMLITGHTSMEALEKYLRDIDAELPEDYSELLKA